MTGRKKGTEVKNTTRPRDAVTAAMPGDPQERLVVRDGENLHLLGRFFQAMILNFLKEPDKVRVIERMNLRVAFEITGHTESALTLSFASGRVVLESGIRPDPDIKIMSEPAVLMKLSRMPAGPAAIRFLLTYEGKDLVARMLSGELKIQGAARHPLGMMKFSKFLGPSTVI
jgi:hypothetical protein